MPLELDGLPDQVLSILQPDEQILWSDRPRVGLNSVLASCVSCLLMSVILLFLFPRFGSSRIATYVFLAVVLFYGLVALAALYSQWKRFRKTVFLITNRRAISVVPRRRGKTRVFILQPEETGILRCHSRANGFGYLMWTERVCGVWAFSLSHVGGFYGVANAAEVHKLLLDTFVPLLIPMLEDPDPEKRRKAAMSLTNVGDHAVIAIPALIGALQHDDSFIRGYAASALGKLGTRAESSVPALRRLQLDEHPSVAKAACGALSEIEKPQARAV